MVEGETMTDNNTDTVGDDDGEIVEDEPITGAVPDAAITALAKAVNTVLKTDAQDATETEIKNLLLTPANLIKQTKRVKALQLILKRLLTLPTKSSAPLPFSRNSHLFAVRAGP